MSETHCIGQYTPEGKRLASISGCGRNKGTWDGLHSQRSAQRHAKELNGRGDGFVYQAEHKYTEAQLRRRKRAA